MTAVTFHIEVPVGPRWQNIELLRTSVLNCLATVFHNEDYCHNVSMVAGELLENAVKYGDWRRADQSSFRLRVEGDDGAVRVEVSNPVSPEGADVRAALAAVKLIGEARSPGDAFRDCLSRVAQRSPGEQTSGLGLARICYEGNCRLDAALEGDVLRMRAIAMPRAA